MTALRTGAAVTNDDVCDTLALIAPDRENGAAPVTDEGLGGGHSRQACSTEETLEEAHHALHVFLLNTTPNDVEIARVSDGRVPTPRGIPLKKKWGERVDDVRTASEEGWSIFLRNFKRWCISEEVRELVKHLPVRPLA